MKKHTGTSQYKNPDRYIERLRNQLANAEGNAKFWREKSDERKKELDELKSIEKSKEWLTYPDDECSEMSILVPASFLELRILRTAKLNQNIVGLGKIIAIHHENGNNRVHVKINSLRIVPE